MVAPLTHALVTIFAGLLAAGSLVVAWRPGARSWFDKLAPYETAIGIGLLAWGGYMLVFQLLRVLGSIAAAPLAMLC